MYINYSIGYAQNTASTQAIHKVQPSDLIQFIGINDTTGLINIPLFKSEHMLRFFLHTPSIDNLPCQIQLHQNVKRERCRERCFSTRKRYGKIFLRPTSNMPNTDTNIIAQNGIEDISKSERTHSNRSDSDLEATQQNVPDDKETRRIIRRIDLRLLPILAAMYSFCLIDRTNVANARVAGANEDLGLNIGSRYSIVTLVFFIPYVLLELPSNIVLRRVGPAIWLPVLVILFGVLGMCCGFTHTWTELLGCRVVLGALEAGFYPGAVSDLFLGSCRSYCVVLLTCDSLCQVYLLSCWYVRFEIQKRFSIFFMIATLASGLANVLGYGLSQIRGGGLEGWRWM